MALGSPLTGVLWVRSPCRTVKVLTESPTGHRVDFTCRSGGQGLTDEAPNHQRSRVVWSLLAFALTAIAVGVVVVVFDSEPDDDAASDSTTALTSPSVPTVEAPDPSTFAADVTQAIDTRDEVSFRALVDDALVNYFTLTGVDEVVALFDWMDIVDLQFAGPLECDEQSTNLSWCFVDQTTAIEGIDGSDYPRARVEVIFRDGAIFSVVILPVDAPRTMPKVMDGFKQFVADRAPDDLAVMYRDAVQIQPSTTQEALDLWRRHVDEYSAEGSR